MFVMNRLVRLCRFLIAGASLFVNGKKVEFATLDFILLATSRFLALSRAMKADNKDYDGAGSAQV